MTSVLQPRPAASIAQPSRYLQALESSPHLMSQLAQAAEESLSLRAEVALQRVLLGELVRILGRASGSDASSAAVVGLVGVITAQAKAVESAVTSCAAIEAKRVDQSLDAAKLVLLLTNLREDLRRSLRDAGMRDAVPFIDAAFDRAKWTGALDDAAVKEALAAPSSFDVAFRPIERDHAGKVREHARAFDTPEAALDAGALPVTPVSVSPQDRFERDKLQAELAQANDALDGEIESQIEAAAAEGAPLPGVSEARTSRLDPAAKKLLEDRG